MKRVKSVQKKKIKPKKAVAMVKRLAYENLYARL